MGNSGSESGAAAKCELGCFAEDAALTAWEPGRRCARRDDEGPGGGFTALEYLIEARDQGSTLLRMVHNGMLGDDWDAQYDAVRKGDRMYLRQLATYLAYFPGRTATYSMFLPGPQVTDHERVWAAFTAVAGLSGTVEADAPARIAVDGLPPADGVVAFADAPGWLSVRTDEGMHLFIHGYRDTVIVEYHGFAPDVDGAEVEKAWQYWLDRSFA